MGKRGVGTLGLVYGGAGLLPMYNGMYRTVTVNMIFV